MRLSKNSKVWNVLGIFLLFIIASLSSSAQNDNFCDAIPITLNPLDTPGDCGAAFPFDNTAATTEAGEPTPGCFADSGAGAISNTVWFSFTGPASGYSTLSTDFAGGGNADTQMAIYEYTGTACPAVDFTALTEIACQEDGGTAVAYNNTITQLATTAGTTYYVMIDGWADDSVPPIASTGTFCLDITEVTAPPAPDPPDPLCGTATETLLLDQLSGSDSPDNGGLADLVPSQNFTDFGASATAADNFTVPAGGWDIGAISVDGVYYGANPGCASSWTVVFYNDAAGLPGTVVCNYTVATSNTIPSPNLTFPNLCSLTAGNYWVSVEPVMAFGACSQWGWYTSGPGDGVGPAWQDPADLFGAGQTTWASAIPTVADVNTDMAFSLFECPPPTTCSVSPVEGASVCNDNGTLSDPSDDTYLIDVTVNGVNPSGTNTFSDDQGNMNQAYGTTLTYGPLAAGTTLTINYGDVDNGFCGGSITITAGAGCSDCSTTSASTVTTPLCSGDPFTVTMNNCIVPSNQNGFLLMYDTDPTNTPPTQAELYDDVTGTVDLPDVFWAGESSECDNLGFQGLAGFTNVTCGVITVDLYLMPADLAALLIDATCPVEGPLTMEIYPNYQIVESGAGTCGPVATLEVTDDETDPANPVQVVCATQGDPLGQCTADEAYDFTADVGASPCPPATLSGSILCNCASCSITPSVATNIICDDNATPGDASDDTFTFEITVNGSNPDAAASNTFGDDQGNAGLAYGSLVSYGPYPISGGAITVNYTDTDDATCIASMTATPPATCSPCASSSGSTVTSPLCADATFDVTINGCVTTADQDGFLLVYDFDPATPETSQEIYDDLTGTVDDLDLFYFGETSDCTGFSGLAGFANTTCAVESYAVYIVPFSTAGYINAGCAPEGPLLIDVYPNLVVNTTSDNSASCGDVTFELVNADDATVVCATNTQSCAVDGTAISYDFANDGYTDPAGCSTLTSTTSTCAGCVIPVYCDDPCFIEYNPSPNPGDMPDPAACITALDCTTGTASMMACDDGDPCTENDMMSVLDCDNTVICVPCAGTAVAACTAPPTMVACDDGDPCTENDMEGIDACDGVTVCVPCAGTAVVACTTAPTMMACDDGDPCTENDMEGIDACDGVTVCVPCAGTAVAACSLPPIMQACDDGDPTTTGEMEGIDPCDGSVCVPCGGGTVTTTIQVSISDPCDCASPLNYSLADGTYLVHDLITITISSPAQSGDIWSLAANAGIPIYDNAGNVLTTGTMTDNGDGTYDFDIWYPGDGSTYGPLTFTQTSTSGAALADQMISGTGGCNCCQAPSSGSFDCN